jgi:hypothetical protein
MQTNSAGTRQLRVTTDLLATKMKHWLQGSTALHEDRPQVPYTYTLDINTFLYGSNHKHDDGAKVGGYTEPAKSHSAPTADDKYIQTAPVY